MMLSLADFLTGLPDIMRVKARKLILEGDLLSNVSTSTHATVTGSISSWRSDLTPRQQSCRLIRVGNFR